MSDFTVYFEEDLDLASWQKQFLQLPLTADRFILSPPRQRGVSLWDQACFLAVASLAAPTMVVVLVAPGRSIRIRDGCVISDE